MHGCASGPRQALSPSPSWPATSSTGLTALGTSCEWTHTAFLFFYPNFAILGPRPSVSGSLLAWTPQGGGGEEWREQRRAHIPGQSLQPPGRSAHAQSLVAKLPPAGSKEEGGSLKAHIPHTSETVSEVKLLVTQSCLTLCNPMDGSLPGSSVHEDSPGKKTGVDCHSLLQWIFPETGLI